MMELSTALLIASMIGFICEPAIRRCLINAATNAIIEWTVLSADHVKDDLITTFETRQKALVHIITDIAGAQKQVILVGISVSIFNETARTQNAEAVRRPTNTLADLIRNGGSVGFWYFKRDHERYARRERDEAGSSSGASLTRLLREANESINDHALPILFNLIVDLNMSDARLAACLNRFAIFEYEIQPVVSLTFIDDVLYAAPYLAKRCTDIPSQRVMGPSPLFRWYVEHFHALEHRAHRLISPAFVTACTERRAEAIEIIKRRSSGSHIERSAEQIVHDIARSAGLHRDVS